MGDLYKPTGMAISRWEASGYEATEYLALTPAEAAAGVAATLTFYDAGGRPYTLTVPIPPGTGHGQRLRLAGVGGPARQGAGRGDLIVVVRVSEHALAERALLAPPPPARATRPPRGRMALAALVAVAALIAVAMLAIALAGAALIMGRLL